MYFLAAFLREISAELLKTLGPLGWASQELHGEKFSLLLFSTEGFSRCFSLCFLALPFLVSFAARSELLPWVRQSKQRCCPLAAALGRRCCPQGWDPISAQRVKFLLPYPWHHLFALLKATGTSANLLTAESHGHIFSQCQIQCRCHVPGTHLSARAGSCWKHWSLLAFTGFYRFNQQLTQTSDSWVKADFK